MKYVITVEIKKTVWLHKRHFTVVVLNFLWPNLDKRWLYVIVFIQGSYFVHFRWISLSGVETGGSGGSMNQGPELLGAPKSGAKKNCARKEYAISEKLKN